ncbi:MAG: hypothetical protein QM729_07065 [Solirubrobacterales bacterium]
MAIPERFPDDPDPVRVVKAATSYLTATGDPPRLSQLRDQLGWDEERLKAAVRDAKRKGWLDW